MLLAIDIGNTNTVFGVHDGEKFVAEWRCSTDPIRTAEEYFVWLIVLMKASNIDKEKIKNAIIAQVVPEALINLTQLCRVYFSCDPLIVGNSNIDIGIKVKLDRPEEVGADRLVNAVAAYDSYGGNVVVLDFGTATTFDIIDESGAYIGGIIAPGANLSLETLVNAAAKLPHIAIERPPKIIGKSTETAMKSGIYWGYIALINGLVTQIERELQQKMKIIATGGLAGLFARDIGSHTDANINLRGLALIFERNKDRIQH